MRRGWPGDGRAFETRAVQAGVARDGAHGSVMTPIYVTSNYVFDAPGRPRGAYDYTRSGNPTRSALEENLASLEGGCAAWATCTGMAAETTMSEAARREAGIDEGTIRLSLGIEDAGDLVRDIRLALSQAERTQGPGKEAPRAGGAQASPEAPVRDRVRRE